MDYLSLLIHFLITCFALWWISAKSYLGQKGRNLADKEDIEDLTEKVENVKTELELMSKIKYDIGLNLRNTAHDFFSHYATFKNSLLRTGAFTVNVKNFENELDINDAYDKLSLEFDNYRDFMNLLDPTGSMREPMYKVSIVLIEMKAMVQKYVAKCSHSYELEKMGLEYAQTSAEKLEISKKRRDANSEATEKYYSDRREIFEKLLEVEAVMIEQLRKHMLIQNEPQQS